PRYAATRSAGRATTCCCAATRRPTPATIRWASGWAAPWAGRASPASRTWRSRRAAPRPRPRARNAAAGESCGSRCPPGSASRGGTTRPLSRWRRGGVGPKRAEIERQEPQWQEEGLRKLLLRVPETERKQATVLGTGADAVPALVDVLAEWGVLP